MAGREDGEYAGSYIDAAIHEALLRDVVRTSSYDQAIREVVTPTSRVIDFGTGSGVLAIFAARAGAAHVDAIERSAMASRAREICRINNCPTIRVHHADHESFSTDGRADLLVSEWMGHFVFYEAMLEPLLRVRDRWLKSGGTIMPNRVSLHVALVTDEQLYEDGAFLRTSPYGIDFSPIASIPLQQTRLVALEESQIAQPYFNLGTLDMLSLSEVPRQLTGRGSVARETLGYGLIGWFSAELTPQVVLGTGPADPPCHWMQMFFPFPEPFVASPSRPIEISIEPPQEEGDDRAWVWRVTDGIQTVMVDEHDTISNARLMTPREPRVLEPGDMAPPAAIS